MANFPPKRRDKGTVLVESAITLLTLFVLLLAIVEAGRFISVQHALTNSARRGARLAVAPVSRTSTLGTQGQVEFEISRYLTAANITGQSVVIERPVIVNTNGVNNEYTRVRVTAPYQIITISLFSDLQITLKGEALMRNETSP